MKILKFGGRTLSNGNELTKVIAIIKKYIDNHSDIAIVVSAREKTTNILEELLETAKNGADYSTKWETFKAYQIAPKKDIDVKNEFQLIQDVLNGVKLTNEYSLKVKDLILAQGEILSAKLLQGLLKEENITSHIVDTREVFETNSNFGNATIHEEISKEKTIAFFNQLPEKTVPIITGFIASNQNKETTTLGRNGSNYTASLVANFLDAEEIISYTHINGIYTANPEIVAKAKVIEHLSFNEAHELASFGIKILHPKTISPLVEKNIPLTILNTSNNGNKKTVISNTENNKSIKAITMQDDVALISIKGKGLLGKKGTDARIFSSLSSKEISIGIVSQGSSERCISFVLPKNNVKEAQEVLLEEFQLEIFQKDIQTIEADENIAVVTIIGQTINKFASSLAYLEQNKIPILLINNTISGSNISLVIPNNNLTKAVNIIHSQIFGATKTLNIAIIGKGTVGSALITQIQNSKAKIEANKAIELNIFAIAGSKKALLNKNGLSVNWQSEYEELKESKNITQQIIDYAQANHLENLVAIDNTASAQFIENYIPFIENGFDLISSNKIANTQDYSKYHNLRRTIKQNNKHYLYETNVGAGLPIIDTIRVLHESGENITRIRGVFSGSLSYLFNAFSESEKPFSYFLKKAVEKGYTEPDAREDLCGNDVARKLLILARELDLKNEFEDIAIDNLIPEALRTGSKEDFMANLEQIDTHYATLKNNLKENQVLRYVGDMGGDLQQTKGELSVKLATVDKNSALGNLKGSDSIIEIFTESYGTNPITIIGAGAGAEVTARGVFGDLLRIADKK